MGKAKILRNIQGGLDEMLIIAYILGGWVQKIQKSAYVIYRRSLIILVPLTSDVGDHDVLIIWILDHNKI